MIHNLVDRFMSFCFRACYPLTAVCVIGAAWLVWRVVG